jgi:hypothetical protein
MRSDVNEAERDCCARHANILNKHVSLLFAATAARQLMKRSPIQMSQTKTHDANPHTHVKCVVLARVAIKSGRLRSTAPPRVHRTGANANYFAPRLVSMVDAVAWNIFTFHMPAADFSPT